MNGSVLTNPSYNTAKSLPRCPWHGQSLPIALQQRVACGLPGLCALLSYELTLDLLEVNFLPHQLLCLASPTEFQICYGFFKL